MPEPGKPEALPEQAPSEPKADDVPLFLDKNLEAPTQPLELPEEEPLVNKTVPVIASPIIPNTISVELKPKPSPPSSRSKKKGTITSSSRKKVQDFLNVHRSRQQSSRKTPRSKLNESPNSEKTGTSKTAVTGTGTGDALKESSSSNHSKKKKKHATIAAAVKAILPSSRSSKRVRATRNQISVEKPITVHPMPPLDDQERAHMDQIQMGTSHVVVKSTLDPKELQKKMKRQNQKYRLVSIIATFIAVTLTFVFLGVATFGAHKMVTVYFDYVNEKYENRYVNQEWELTRIFTDSLGMMIRTSNYSEEWSTCKLPRHGINNQWTNWSDCIQNSKYRHRIIKDKDPIYFNSFSEFSETNPCNGTL